MVLEFLYIYKDATKTGIILRVYIDISSVYHNPIYVRGILFILNKVRFQLITLKKKLYSTFLNIHWVSVFPTISQILYYNISTRNRFINISQYNLFDLLLNWFNNSIPQIIILNINKTLSLIEFWHHLTINIYNFNGFMTL